MRLSPVPMSKNHGCSKTLPCLRKDALRVSGRGVSDLRAKPLHLQEESKSEICGRKRKDASAHGQHNVLASGGVNRENYCGGSGLNGGRRGIVSRRIILLKLHT